MTNIQYKQQLLKIIKCFGFLFLMGASYSYTMANDSTKTENQSPPDFMQNYSKVFINNQTSQNIYVALWFMDADNQPSIKIKTKNPVAPNSTVRLNDNNTFTDGTYTLESYIYQVQISAEPIHGQIGKTIPIPNPGPNSGKNGTFTINGGATNYAMSFTPQIN